MLTRIATFKSGKNAKAIIVEISGKRLEIAHADLSAFDTAKKIEDELNNQASLSNVQPPKFFAHINRDGSIALATSIAPDVWPENESSEGK